MEYFCVNCNKGVTLKNERDSRRPPFKCITCVNKDPARSLKVKQGLNKRSKEKIAETSIKRKKTNLTKYGVEIASKCDAVKLKLKQTNIKKYGYDNPSKSPLIIQKIKDVSFAKYGVYNPAQAQVNRDKISRGLKNSSFDRSTFSKNRLQCLKDQGIETSGAVNKEISHKTCMERYGANTFFGSELGRFNKQTFIEIYGWNEEQYANHIDNKRHNIENFIKRHGEIEGKEKYKEYIKSTTHNIENFIKRHGEIEGKEKYKEYLIKKAEANSFGIASKESLKFFIPLYKKIRKMGLRRKDIYFGISGSKEYFLSSHIDGEHSFCLYDFTILPLKMIIEYNGVIWHAKETSDLEYIRNFKIPFSKNSYEEQILKEKRKKAIAEFNNFEVITVWSDDNQDYQEKNIISKVKEKINGIGQQP